MKAKEFRSALHLKTCLDGCLERNVFFLKYNWVLPFGKSRPFLHLIDRTQDELKGSLYLRWKDIKSCPRGAELGLTRSFSRSPLYLEDKAFWQR